MKRSLSILVFALVAISNLYAQMTETPVSYAYLPGRESTLKYKFSYGEEKFFTNLRLIKGSANAFLAGDKIILEPNKGNAITFALTEDMLSGITSEYIPFEVSAEELDNLQKGIKGISLVRDGRTLGLEQNKYFNTSTRKNANIVTHNAYKIQKIENERKNAEEIQKIIEERLAIERKIIEERRNIIKEEKEFEKEAKQSGINNIGLSWRDKFNGWKGEFNSLFKKENNTNNVIEQTSTSIYPSWRD